MAGQPTAIVDAQGRGDFRTVQAGVDAVEALVAAGLPGGAVYVRAGTYSEAVVIAQANISVQGESWDTIIDGGTTGHAIQCSKTGGNLSNFQAKTTGGGGNNYDAIVIDGSSTFISVSNCYVSDSDRFGILMNNSPVGLMVTGCHILNADSSGVRPAAWKCRIENCWIADNGGDGVELSSGNADDCVLVGNMVIDNSGYGINIAAGDENCVVAGNRVTGNASGQINDLSDTSIVTGNNET